MKRSSPVLLTLVFTACATLLYAGSPKTPKDWKQAKWNVSKRQFDVVTAVNPAAGTMSIRHVGGSVEQEHDLTTNVFTEIIVDGKKATLASLNKGTHVSYVLGSDGKTAARVETVVEPPPPPTPVPTATPSFPTNHKKK